jgi:hypothetical protein
LPFLDGKEYYIVLDVVCQAMIEFFTQGLRAVQPQRAERPGFFAFV